MPETTVRAVVSSRVTLHARPNGVGRPHIYVLLTLIRGTASPMWAGVSDARERLPPTKNAQAQIPASLRHLPVLQCLPHLLINPSLQFRRRQDLAIRLPAKHPPHELFASLSISNIRLIL